MSLLKGGSFIWSVGVTVTGGAQEHVMSRFCENFL